MAKKEPHPEEELLVLHERWVKAAREHLKEIILAAVLLVLAAALWAGFSYYRQNRENKASILYAQALMKNKNQREQALREVIKRYGGTAASLQAHLSLYEIYLEEENLSKAFEELSFLRRKAKKPWSAFLDLGLGYLQEDQNRLKESEKDYLRAAKARVGLETLAYLDLARVAEIAGHYEAAVKYYQEFLSHNPQGPILDFVQVQLAKLSARLETKNKGG